LKKAKKWVETREKPKLSVVFHQKPGAFGSLYDGANGDCDGILGRF
jgi:hypothetical protein